MSMISIVGQRNVGGGPAEDYCWRARRGLNSHLHDDDGGILVQRYFEKLHDWRCDIYTEELAPVVTDGAHAHDESDPEINQLNKSAH